MADEPTDVVAMDPGVARAEARKLYCEPYDDSVQIDADAEVSQCEDGAAWVQAWLLVPAKKEAG